MKIVVTGANGYLGTGVVKQLCDDGHDVIAVCHSRTDNVDSRADIKQCDIFDIIENTNAIIIEYSPKSSALHIKYIIKVITNKNPNTIKPVFILFFFISSYIKSPLFVQNLI